MAADDKRAITKAADAIDAALAEDPSDDNGRGEECTLS
jgi:hypothetical protein